MIGEEDKNILFGILTLLIMVILELTEISVNQRSKHTVKIAKSLITFYVIFCVCHSSEDLFSF
jgi:hypothetical protein